VIPREESQSVPFEGGCTFAKQPCQGVKKGVIAVRSWRYVRVIDSESFGAGSRAWEERDWPERLWVASAGKVWVELNYDWGRDKAGIEGLNLLSTKIRPGSRSRLLTSLYLHGVRGGQFSARRSRQCSG